MSLLKCLLLILATLCGHHASPYAYSYETTAVVHGHHVTCTMDVDRHGDGWLNDCHTSGPVRAIPVTVVRHPAPFNPCAPGHKPVDPDAGHCTGTLYIPS